jgi:type VI secretion system protein ImpH
VAAENGRTDLALADLLFQYPYEFDFFQAVRLLGLCHPNRQLLSGLGKSNAELVRFRALLSMNFPPSAIHNIERGDPIKVTVAFMGLTGPLGVLPSHYTEFLIWRSFEKDTTAEAFFNLFNHRFIAFLYLAWAKHNLAAAYEHERTSPSPGRGFSQYLFDLIGMGTAGLHNRLQVPDEALLLYAGLIAQRPHSASALRGLLEDYFQVHTEVRQLVGEWFSLEKSDLSYLNPEGLHNQLGFGAIAGDQVWNQQAGFLVQLGPLTYSRFLAFLPGMAAFRKLVNLVRYFVDQALDFEVQLILKAQEVPLCRLSDDADSPRLGWSTWLRTDEFSHDAQDTILAAVNG